MPTRRSFLQQACWMLVASSGLARRLWTQETATAHEVVRGALERADLSLMFDGRTPAACRDWQARFREKLDELLGPHDPPNEWSTEIRSQATFDDHTRLELQLNADGVPALPVYLLIPRAASAARPSPAVLCVHGHGNYGHHPIVGRRDMDGVANAIEGANYDYGLQFVRRGYVVAAPCMTPFGDRVDRSAYGGNDPCAVHFVRLQALGKLPITENLRDLRWAISLLQSRDEVRADRIGCAGLSYGGRMTMLCSAVDERIKVAAVSGALNLMQERMSHRHSCGSQMIPGLLKYGDYSEIGSLIAPRPCVWEVGSDDGLIVAGWSDKFRERLGRAYGALGAADQLRFDDFSGGHRWNGVVAFPLFDQVLRA